MDQLHKQLKELALSPDKNRVRVRALLRKLLVKGGNVSGYYSLIQSQGKAFSSLFGSWARKRGRMFQIEVRDWLESSFNQAGLSCWVYRSANERCATQLYDLVVYLKGRVPIFVECKAGGIKYTGKGPTVDRNCRAMKNYKDRVDLLKDLSEKLDYPYFFIFPGPFEKYFVVPLSEFLNSEGNFLVKDEYLVDNPQKLRRLYEEQAKIYT